MTKITNSKDFNALLTASVKSADQISEVILTSVRNTMSTNGNVASIGFVITSLLGNEMFQRRNMVQYKAAIAFINKFVPYSRCKNDDGDFIFIEGGDYKVKKDTSKERKIFKDLCNIEIKEDSKATPENYRELENALTEYLMTLSTNEVDDKEDAERSIFNSIKPVVLTDEQKEEQKEERKKNKAKQWDDGGREKAMKRVMDSGDGVLVTLDTLLKTYGMTWEALVAMKNTAE